MGRINPPDDSEFLPELEAAQMLCVSRESLRTWRVRGIGPRWFKFSSLVRYRRADLDRFIAESARHGPSSAAA